MQKTFSIIKPDAVKRNLIGHINQIIESSGLRIIASKKMYLTKTQAETFYSVHKERPFFNSLVNYMTSGPVQVQVLEGSDAVSNYRKIMGATNPEQAEKGTIRKLYAESIEANSVHGSDSPENAEIEISFFFSGAELV
jgi:nucleoside-diphosphate kinase